jgi:hypothetical protein
MLDAAAHARHDGGSMTTKTKDPLTAEMVGESALSLGRAGARLQRALDALAAHDVVAGDPAARAGLVDDAGEAAWGYVVLRGALGWHDDRAALDVYAVPAEVRARMGVIRRPEGATTAAPPRSVLDSPGAPYR